MQRGFHLVEPLDRLARRAERSPGRGEGDKERVALSVDLDAAVVRERIAQQAPVLAQGPGICLGTEVVEQPGRAFDVGEEERDCSGRQISRHEAHDDLARHACTGEPARSASSRMPSSVNVAPARWAA